MGPIAVFRRSFANNLFHAKSQFINPGPQLFDFDLLNLCTLNGLVLTFLCLGPFQLRTQL